MSLLCLNDSPLISNLLSGYNDDARLSGLVKTLKKYQDEDCATQHSTTDILFV